MTAASAKDLAGLLLVLFMIISAMMAFRSSLEDQQGDAQRDWYYERVARKTQSAPQPGRDQR